MPLKLGLLDVNPNIEAAYLGSDLVYSSNSYQITLDSLNSDYLSFDTEKVLADGETFEITTKLKDTFAPRYITSGINEDWGLYINTNRTCILKIGGSDFHTFTFPYQFELGTFLNILVSRVGNIYDVSINSQVSNGSWTYGGVDAFRIKVIGGRLGTFVDMEIDSFKMNGINYNLTQGSGSTFQGVTINTSSVTPDYIDAVMWGESTNLPIDIYEFLGQSNQDGRGDLIDTPKYLTYDFDVKWIGWGGSFANLQAGINSPNTSYFQSCIKFAYDLKIEDVNRDFRILQVSQGGTSLHTDWADGGTQRNRYDNARDALNGRLWNTNTICTNWMQGEADSTQQIFADDYYANLTEFVNYCKSKNGGALFIDGKVRELSTGVPFASTVNAAKQQVFDDNLSNGVFSTESYPMQPDNLHYTTSGLLLLADDFRSRIPNYVSNPYINEYNAVLSKGLNERYEIPTEALRTKQNTLFSSLVNDGIFNRLDTFAVLTDSSENFALIDWINTDNLYTAVDNYEWNTNGFSYTGILPFGHVNTNYKPSLGINNSSSSSSYFSAVSSVSLATGNRALFGSEINGSWLRLKAVATEPVGAIHQTGAANQVVSPNNGAVDVNYLMDALNGVNSLYEDGVSVASTPYATQGTENYDVYLLAMHRSGTAQQNYGADGRIKYFGSGSSLGDKSTELNTALETYYL